MQQAHVYISGFVQGIGFRGFIKSSAKKNNVAGWVRNLPDGRVEAVFQAPKLQSDKDSEKLIEKIIELCKKGPFMVEVRGVEVIWENVEENYSDFEIVF